MIRKLLRFIFAVLGTPVVLILMFMEWLLDGTHDIWHGWTDWLTFQDDYKDFL